MMFALDAQQFQRLGTWLDEQHAKLVAVQERDPEVAPYIVTIGDKKQPYLGAIGGALTYEFTPTGLGIITKVTFCKGLPGHEATVDLTDYDEW